MAIKPTIFKFKISLSDLNRDHYDQLDLTVARHPSETNERMMARVMAYCLHAQEFLSFTKGLSAVDEPDIWAKSLDDQLLLWLDVGEPSVERIKKATRLAKQTVVYSFNSKSSAWWRQQAEGFSGLNVKVMQFDWEQIQALANLVDRNVDMSVMITGDSAYISAAKGDVELSWLRLSAPD